MTPDQRSLRIAQVAPVAAPVRPGDGDSIEQLVSLLTEELVRRDHDVTLYATGNSETSARLRALYPRGYDEEDELWDWQFAEICHAGHAFEHEHEHDLVHAHNYGYAIPFASLIPIPLLDTPHAELAPEVRAGYLRRPDNLPRYGGDQTLAAGTLDGVGEGLFFFQSRRDRIHPCYLLPVERVPGFVYPRALTKHRPGTPVIVAIHVTGPPPSYRVTTNLAAHVKLQRDLHPGDPLYYPRLLGCVRKT